MCSPSICGVAASPLPPGTSAHTHHCQRGVDEGADPKVGDLGLPIQVDKDIGGLWGGGKGGGLVSDRAFHGARYGTWDGCQGKHELGYRTRCPSFSARPSMLSCEK